MANTTTTYGFTYPDTKAVGVTWAAQYEANLLLIEQVITGQKLWNIARSAWESKRAGIGYYPSVANNGSNKIRVTCAGHGLITGDSIDIHDSSVAGYNGTGLSVTRITADTFDISAIAYSATATGYWICAANAFKASDQDGAIVPGSVIRSLYAVNMPNVNGTPSVFTCSDLVRAEYGGSALAGYQRDRLDIAFNKTFDFVRTEASSEIKWYTNNGAATSGKLYRIDYVP